MMWKWRLGSLIVSMFILSAVVFAGANTTSAQSGTATSASPVATPAPTATTLPVVASYTAMQPLTHIDIGPIAGKTGSFDILEIDQEAHLLYVADRTDNGVDVLDVSTPTATYLRTIDVGSGANGVSVAKDVNKLFVANNNSEIVIIDITPGATGDTILARLNTGGKKRADEMDYDPTDHKLYVANSDDGIVTAIDAVNNTVITRFDNLGEGLEQPRYNAGDGMMYMTSSTQNAVFLFDPTKDVLVKKMDVGVVCGPNGLAINPKTNQALLGCSDKKTQATVIFDLTTGQALTSFYQAGAGDSAIYNATADRFFFAASGYYRGGQLAVFSGGAPVQFITNVPTTPGSHAVAYDETNNIVYVPDQRPNMGGVLSFPAPA